jgi:hypothetical protein
VQNPFEVAAASGRIVDVAFIGNTGARYPWEPSMFIDVDIVLFVDALEVEISSWLGENGKRCVGASRTLMWSGVTQNRDHSILPLV